MRIAVFLGAVFGGLIVQSTSLASVVKFQFDGYGIIETEQNTIVPDKNSPTGHQYLFSDARLLSKTASIPARMGTTFGVMWTPTGPSSEIIEVMRVIRMPGIKNPATGEVVHKWVGKIEAELGSPNALTYTIGADWQAVPGTWTFEIWYQGRKVIDHSFTLYNP